MLGGDGVDLRIVEDEGAAAEGADGADVAEFLALVVGQEAGDVMVVEKSEAVVFAPRLKTSRRVWRRSRTELGLAGEPGADDLAAVVSRS